jgi:hypothetical protein
MASYRSSFIEAFKDFVRSIVEGVGADKAAIRLPTTPDRIELIGPQSSAEFADIRAPIKAWI